MEPSSPSELEQNIAQVMQMLPPPVRQYLASGTYSVVAKDLTIKHGLHMDQGSILEREIMLLLMGIENPSEFMEALTSEAAIPQPVVKDIMLEINQKIFTPLQEEMRKGAEILKQQPPKPITPPVQPRINIPPERNNIIPANPQFPQRPPPLSAQSYGGARQINATTPKYFNLENKIPPPPPINNPQNGLAAALKQVLHEGHQTSLPTKSVNVGRLLEDHEEPHIDVSSKVQTVSPTPSSGVIPPGVRFSPLIAPKVEPQIPPAPPVQAKPIPPPVSFKPYSTDPYREPIDTP